MARPIRSSGETQCLLTTYPIWPGDTQIPQEELETVGHLEHPPWTGCLRDPSSDEGNKMGGWIQVVSQSHKLPKIIITFVATCEHHGVFMSKF